MEGSMTASTALTKRAESFVTDVGKKERLDSTSGSLEKTEAQVSTEQSSERREGEGEKEPITIIIIIIIILKAEC